MSIKIVTLINVEREPNEYHSGDKPTYSVQLSANVVVGEGHAATDGQVRKLYHEWIDDLPKLSFYLYRKDPQNLDKARLVEIIAEPPVSIGPNYEDLKAWLDEGEELQSLEGTEDSTLEIDDSNVGEYKPSLSDMLRSAGGWIAPVPQNLLLTRLVSFNDNPGSDLFVVAMKSGSAPDSLPAQYGEDVAEFKIDEDDTEGLISYVRTNIVPESGDFPDFLVDGFLKIKESSEDDFRIVQRLEETAASQLWFLPQMLDLPLDVFDSDEVPGLDSEAWRQFVLTATVSALDPLVIALLMPGQSDVEGPILGSLVSTGLELLALPPGKKPEDYTHAERDEVAAKRKFLTTELVKKFRESLRAEAWLDPAAAIDDTAETILMKLGIDEGDVLWKTLLSGNRPEKAMIPPTNAVVSRLRDLAASLEAEEGIERVLLTVVNDVLERVSAGESDVIQKFLLEKLKGAFEAKINSPYNGLEAIRRGVGQVVVGLLTKHDPGNLQSLMKLVPASLRESEFFVRRLRRMDDAGPALDEILSVFWQSKFDHKQFDAELIAALGSYVNRLKLNLDEGPRRRFVPDPAPLPLPIQVAPGVSADVLERFEESHQGIGVIISKGEPASWRHACLVNVYPEGYDPDGVSNESGRELAKLSLQSLSLVTNDRQQAMHLPYRGFPLASTAFDVAGAGEAVGAPEKISPVPPFYALHDIDNDKAVPPKLAYGFEYSVAAFAVTQAGVMPRSVQLRDDSPWLPNPKPDPDFGDEDKQIYKAGYRRCTAVGRIDIRNTEFALPEDRRIGRDYADVHPLALDNPRLSIAAGAGMRSTLDLFRNVDGSGGIDLSPLFEKPGEPVRISLENLYSTGGGGEVRLRCFNKPYTDFPTNEHHESVELEQNRFQNVDVLIYGEEPEGQIAGDVEFVIALGPESAGAWLQFELQSGENGSSSLSMDRPETDAMPKMYSSDPLPPVLLLAPKDGDSWKAPFNQNFSGVIDLPRVGFLDFEHWIANPSRFREIQPDADDQKAFIDMLIEAYLIRGRASEIAKLLDGLPDPAVSGVLVGVEAVDSFSDAIPDAVVKCFTIGPMSINISNYRDKWTVEDYLKWLKGISDQHLWNLECECSNAGPIAVPVLDGQTLKISLPEGIVAKVWVRPIVKKDLVGEMFNPRIRELVIGQYTRAVDRDPTLYDVFRGSELTVETLSDGLKGKEGKDLASDAISIRPAKGGERGYDLVADLSGSRANGWRYVKSVECFTQRWRFSGSPIYNWISPRDYSGQGAGSLNKGQTAVLPIAGRSDDERKEIKEFEEELYYDRDSADAASLTTLLEGVEGRNLLQRIEWPEASATWHRHRFRLWSRYRGAMAGGATPSIDTRSDSGVWTLRAAILADPGRLQLTRPQLRALIPLTRRAGEAVVNGQAVSPPLLGIHEEPPFAIGGLADRVIAGVGSGVGYGFEGTPADPGQVKPLDIRREMGRDARISLRPESSERGMSAYFSVEGPIGLTFDRSDVDAPAWRNSQHVLNPAILRTEDNLLLPETFLRVTLQRFLDPDWTVRQERSQDDPGLMRKVDARSSQSLVFLELDSSQAWIIEKTGGEEKLCLRIGEALVATLDREGTAYTVKVNQQVLDSSVAEEALMPLCSADASLVDRLALVHQPQSDGAGNLIVLAMPIKEGVASAPINEGRPEVPSMLAKIEWSVDFEGKRPNIFVEHCESAEATEKQSIKARIISLSSATSMQWARTAKPNNVVFKATDADNREALDVTSLRLRLIDEKGYQLISDDDSSVSDPKAVWIQPDEQVSHHPRTRHSHLVAVLTKPADGLGRSVECFAEAFMVVGSIIGRQLDTSVTGMRLGEIQVPARAIVNLESSACKDYKKQYFDLYALTGGKAASCLHFYIRFICTQNTELGQQLELAFTAQDKKGNDLKPLSIKIDAEQGDQILKAGRSVDLWLFKSGGNLRGMTRVRNWNGSVGSGVEIDIPDTLDWDEHWEKGELLGITLEMKTGNGGELWADVSLLPSMRRKEPKLRVADSSVQNWLDCFDFDWVFSQRGGLSNIPDAVSVEKLSKLPEASAQWVAWSPKIPLD